MLPDRVPGGLRDEVRRKLGQSRRPLGMSTFYRRVQNVVDEYATTITSVEASFILASRTGVDVRQYLDKEGCDRVLDLINKAPQRRTREGAAARAQSRKRQAQPQSTNSETCRRRSIDVFDCCSFHPAIRSTSRALFRGRHYAQAVEEALKLYNNAVKERLGRPTKSNGQEYDGAELMDYAFGSASAKPRLRINEYRTDSQKSEQRGCQHIARGAMIGLRNPRAHESGFADEAAGALQLLGLISYLMDRLDKATRTRRTGKT